VVWSVWIQIAGSTVIRNVLPQWRQVRLSPSLQVAWLPRLEDRLVGVFMAACYAPDRRKEQLKA
jgi:hypothetical protein